MRRNTAGFTIGAHNVGNPSYLYLTPLIMVDGQVPMVGSNKEAPEIARSAIAASLKARPDVAIGLTWKEAGSSPTNPRDLSVAVSGRSSRGSGRPILIGVVVYENDLRTEVPTGENAGTTYIGHNVVRSLAFKAVTPPTGRPEVMTMPVTLEPGWVAANCGVAVFAQDETTGRVLQVNSLPWASRAENPPATAPATETDER